MALSEAIKRSKIARLKLETGDYTSDTCLLASQAGEGGACTFAGNSVYFNVGPISAFATFVGRPNLVGTG
jgi:hypothetical protein